MCSFVYVYWSAGRYGKASRNVVYLLTKTAYSFRSPQAYMNGPNKPSGPFVVVGAEFRRPCVCFTVTARCNTDIIVLRKREVVTAFQPCEHTGADMNGQDFLIDQCIVSRKSHALTLTWCLKRSRTNQREGQNG